MSTDKTTPASKTSFSKQSDAQVRSTSQTLSSDYAVGHDASTTTTQPHTFLAPPRFVPVPQGTVAQMASSDYTVKHQTNTATKQPRALPPLPKPLSFAQVSITSTSSSDYPVSHSGFAQKPATFSSSSGTITQTVSSDYPVPHSDATSRLLTKLITENVKTVKKEKIAESELAEEEKDDSEDTETLNPFLGAKRLPRNAITVGALLGQGAFGQVYRGEWGKRPVALKKIDLTHAKKQLSHFDEFQILESLQWEVSRLSTVSHPNLVQFYGVYEPKENELPYLVMEFCEGGTLQSVLEREQTKLPWSKRWQWALEIAQGLAYLHHQGVLHRDLKAENVLIDGNGRAKLGDLGVAQVDALLQGKEAQIVESGLQDKRFIAPENVGNPTLSTQSTDIYTLGLVFWQLVTGKKPRRLTELSKNEFQLWLRGGEREPIPNDCPPSFKALILTCWTREPEKRLSVEKLVTQLNHLAIEFHPKPELIKVCEQLELMIHPKRQEALHYVTPYVTERQVDELLDTYWQRWEAKSLEKLSADEKRQNPPLKLEETLVNFVQSPGSSTLLLLGESGLGKTLSAYQWSDQLLSQWWQHFNDPVSKPLPSYLPLFIRPLVSQWTHRNLKDAFLNTLKTTGLQGTKIPLLVIIDAYDECQLDEAPRNLASHLGLSGQNNIKLIVTCRPNIVPATELSTRFAFQGQLQVQHFLPFKVDQLLTYLKDQLAWEDILYQQYQTQLKTADQLRAVLRNPFVVYLFTESWETVSKQELRSLNRFKIYEGYVEHSLISQKKLLLKKIQVALTSEYSSLLESFNAFASEVAFKAFQTRRLNLSREVVQSLTSPWSLFEIDFEKATRERFLARQKKLAKQSVEGKIRRALLSETDYVQLMHQRREQFERKLPLKRKEQVYEYIHKSLFEYFTAKHLLQLIKYDSQTIQTQGLILLNVRPIQEENEILVFWYEGWATEHQVLIEPFFKVIETSTKNKNVSQAAANAATLLNTARVSFAGRNLERVQIPRADLSRALLDHTNFQGANLQGAQLDKAFLRKTNLRQANLMDIELKELPSLQFNNASRITYSPDESYLAVDNMWDIELWKANGSECITTFHETNSISCIAFDPTSKLLASAVCDDNSETISVWDVVNQKKVAIFRPDSRKEIITLTFSPNSMFLASGSADKTIRLWSIKQQKEIFIFRGHTDEVSEIAFDPTGGTLASASIDGTVRLWSVEKQKEIAVFEHEDCVITLAFDPTGAMLATAGEDNMIYLWEISKRKEIATLAAGTKGISSLTFDSTGEMLASASGDNTVRLWSVIEKREIEIFESGPMVSKVVFQPKGNLLVAWCIGTVHLWEIKTRQKETIIHNGHTAPITCLIFDQRKGLLLSGSDDKTIRLWDIENQKEVAIFRRHTERVSSIAFDSTNQILASGSGCYLDDVRSKSMIEDNEGEERNYDQSKTRKKDNSIRLWSAVDQKEIATLIGHTGEVTGVAFSPTSALLVSGSVDGTIRVWSTTEKKEIFILRYGRREVNSIVFDSTGHILASACGRTVELWSISEKKVIATLTHPDPVLTVAFNRTNAMLASGSKNVIRIWSVTERKEITTFRGHTNEVTSVIFSQVNDQLASASRDGTIRLWSLENKKELAILEGYTMVFSPTGDQLVSANNKSILVWQCINKDYRQWQVMYRIMAVGKLTALGTQLEGAIISDQNRKLLEQRGATEQDISLHPIQQKKEAVSTTTTTTTTTTTAITTTTTTTTLVMNSLPEQEETVSAATKKHLDLKEGVGGIAFSHDGCWLAVAIGNNIELWTGNGSKKARVLKGHTYIVMSVSFDPSGERLASGSADKTIRLWSVATGKVLAVLKGHQEVVSSVVFNPLGEHLASGSWDGSIRLWLLEIGEVLTALEGHTDAVNSVAFDPSGNYLASGGRDKTVRLWSMITWQTLITFVGHTGFVNSVVFDPSGKHLASSGDGNSVRLWLVPDAYTPISSKLVVRKTLAMLEGHKGYSVASVAFDPLGRYLASGSWDKTVQLWSVVTWKNLAILEGHTTDVTSLVFDPSGKCLASGSKDKTVRLWELTGGKVLTTSVKTNNATNESSISSDSTLLPFYNSPLSQPTSSQQDSSKIGEKETKKAKLERKKTLPRIISDAFKQKDPKKDDNKEKEDKERDKKCLVM